MVRSRLSEEKIIGFLRQAEASMPIKELCRNSGLRDATFSKWRAKFGGMKFSKAQRLREFESLNAKRRRLWQSVPAFATLDDLNAWLEQRCQALWHEIEHGKLPGTVADPGALCPDARAKGL